MSANDDILVEMSDEEIQELLNMYMDVEDAFYAYTLIDMISRWKNKQQSIKITVTSPESSWRNDGSIVVLLDYRSKSVAVFSLENSYKNIHRALTKTKRILPSEKIYFLNICESYVDIILDSIKLLQRKISFKLDSVLYTMSIEKAKTIKVNVPENTYVKKLTREHSREINEVWPHNFENSQDFISVYIELNGGYGLFDRENEELVAWVLQGHLGHINLLQTKEGHRGKGYGKVMLQIITKHIAESGCVPIGSILLNNIPSLSLFERLGFKKTLKTNYIFTERTGRNEQ